MTVGYESYCFKATFEAKEDLNSYQYHFVQSEGPASGSVGLVNVASGGSLPGPIGVLQNDPRAGEEASVVMGGVTQLRVNAAGSTICQGRYLLTGSDGHGEPYGLASTGCGFVNAIALGYTASDDVLIEAFVQLNQFASSAS